MGKRGRKPGATWYSDGKGGGVWLNPDGTPTHNLDGSIPKAPKSGYHHGTPAVPDKETQRLLGIMKGTTLVLGETRAQLGRIESDLHWLHRHFEKKAAEVALAARRNRPQGSMNGAPGRDR